MNRWRTPFLDYSDYQVSYARIETKYFFIEKSFTIMTVSIETLFNKVKSVIKENFEFEFRYKSNLLTLFGIFELSFF